MLSALSPPRHWIGHWLMLGAAIHTLFGLLGFPSVGQDPQRAAVAFFLLFGFLLAVLAQATTALEHNAQHASLRRVGWSLLLLSAVAVVLMPASGFWLAGPALWSLLRRPAR